MPIRVWTTTLELLCHTTPFSFSPLAMGTSRPNEVTEIVAPAQTGSHQPALGAAIKLVRIFPISMNWPSPAGFVMNWETPSSLRIASSFCDRDELHAHTGT